MSRPNPKPVSRRAATGPSTRITIGINVEAGDWPPRRALRGLAGRAVGAATATAGLKSPRTELGILFSDDARVRVLNAGWRGNDKPTNVLSFPAFSWKRGDPLPPMLGDVVLAAETVRREAGVEGKPFEHHLTHLIVHGVLHLLGYDHETDADAEEMEGIERRALASLAIPDPYA